MAPDELLARLAVTMRQEIGPVVAEPFAKTQAFMASVILEKLSAQLRLADEQRNAEREDIAALVADLEPATTGETPTAVTAAVERLRAGAGADALSALVAALYAERADLGEERFNQILSRVRRTLRARIDRQMAFAS